MTQAAAADESRRVGRVARQGQDRQLSDDGISREDAEGRAAAALKARDEREANLRTENKQLVEHANLAGRAASESALARIAERGNTLTNNVDVAKKAIESARVAKAAARTASDDAAFDAADEAFVDAKVALRVAEAEKSAFDAQKPRLEDDAKKVAAPIKATPMPSQEAQKWLDDHPLFHTDTDYHDDAIDAHDLALTRGLKEGTTDYVKFIDKRLEKLHGKDHGKEKPVDEDHDQGADRTGGGQDDDRDSSRGAPPSRDQNVGGTMTVDGKSLRLVTGNDGKKSIRGTIPAKWQEAAGWVGMNPVEYAIQQLEIAEETKAGHAPGIRMGDGMIYK